MNIYFELFGFATLDEDPRIGGFWFCKFDNPDVDYPSQRSLFHIYFDGDSTHLGILFFKFEI